MKEVKVKESNIMEEVYELAKEKTENGVKATIEEQMNDLTEIKASMEDLKYELWKEEQTKDSIKATIKNKMSDWKEIKTFMEDLNYELWKEFN